jgi:hypothetical protein
LRRRDIRRATFVWPLVQPCSSIAGTSSAPRICVLPVPVPVVFLEDTVPVSWLSVTSAGIARAMSRRACSQSKREVARSLTVATRSRAIDSKSA